MSDTVYSFRCKTCGRLATSDDAASAPHPHACCVCGSGVVFKHHDLLDELIKQAHGSQRFSELVQELRQCDPATKRLVADNWEVLADCTPERLKELDLTPERVKHHTPWPKGQVPERLATLHFGAPYEAGADRPARHVFAEASEGTAVANGAKRVVNL